MPPAGAPPPYALIAPHAGYVYSGPIAASAYARLRSARDEIARVVLLGPSHRVAFDGLAASSAEAFETPLGNVPLDRAAIDRLVELPQVRVFDAAHADEHSLEVHLPFLKETLDEFRLVPLAVGDAAPRETAEVLEVFWDDPATITVISSDLSHFEDHATAQRLDRATADSIEALEPVSHFDACGSRPINGLLDVVKHRGLRIETLDLRDSSDTAGSLVRVVGYGAFAVVDATDSTGHVKP